MSPRATSVTRTFRSLGLAALAFANSIAATETDLLSVLSRQDNLTTFLDLVKDHPDIYNILPTDTGVTIIAPNDAAFVKGAGWDQDEQRIPVWLTYGILDDVVNLGNLEPGDTISLSTLLNSPAHANVTGGQKVFVTVQPGGEVILSSGSGTHVTVVGLDIPFDGGVVQITESLMVTPTRLEHSIRNSYTDLSAFLGALYAADLVQEFAETPNATILAPHNHAFQRFAGTFEDMDQDELRRVLRYHLVPDAMLRASDLLNNTNVATGAEDGEKVYITRFINDIYVNTAKIIQTDLLVANGIIQMIDSVLNVDEHDARPDVTRSAQVPVFTATGQTAAGTAAAIPFTSALPCTASCVLSSSYQPTGTAESEATSTISDNAAVPTGLPVGLGMGVAAAGLVGMGLLGVV
ncbi:Fasciclin-domain-containing protein [Sodiomyces alkalinus F11]|uniref:Fasciclin-domain-containing protein n=1 Tax=Sodiomyces alkalinus (strain CBS 110278 / VKM F-3762 / F11) TaxID=1314773 RepID=A0A3N2Q3E5_SODAK|nr:Fasciclin-domain-containing protein [Sodiomyces alkalinus F11]ROT41280.1 Fasciclin-domain-containing protein [Sodiomyces alkalinus F11]